MVAVREVYADEISSWFEGRVSNLVIVELRERRQHLVFA